MYIQAIEEVVARMPARTERALDSYQTQELLRWGGYHRSYGLGVGEHFRKQKGQGCFHLRVVNGRGALHWDERDPERDPVGHFFEAPQLWGTAFAAVLVIGLSAVAVSAASSSR